MRKSVTQLLILTILAMLSINVYAKANDFPGRAKYPELPYIELNDLYDKRNNVVIVDARSTLEFETL